MGIHQEFRDELNSVAAANDNFLVLDKCQDESITKVCGGGKQYKYPQILQVRCDVMDLNEWEARLATIWSF